MKAVASADPRIWWLHALASATVTLQDRPYNIWKRAHFTAAQLADPAVSGDNATPARDNMANLMKYALGLTPTNTYIGAFNPAASNGRFVLTYTQSTAAPDVALTFGWSPDLRHWYTGPAYFVTNQITDHITNQLITLQGTMPAVTNGFIKAQATRL